MLSFLPKTPTDIMHTLKGRFRAKRKSLKITQNDLSIKSGVSFGSIKRFEQSGQISLESLLKLAVVLGCLEGFEGVCGRNDIIPQSIEEILAE